MESREDLPPGEQPPRPTVEPAARRPAARDKYPAEAYDWPYWAVVLPCLAAFAAAGLIVAWSLAFQPTNGFDLAGSAVAWVQADRAVQLAACLATAALVIAAAQRPRWRKAIALTVWGIVTLQIGSFVLSASQYPGNSCAAQPAWATITLSDSSPEPVVTAPPGTHIVVIVPGWWTGTATDVGAASGGILREECTISLSDGGRRTVFAAVKPGTTQIVSVVALHSGWFYSHFGTPDWFGEVIVRGAPASWPSR